MDAGVGVQHEIARPEFMRASVRKYFFEQMRERAVSNVMDQGRSQGVRSVLRGKAIRGTEVCRQGRNPREKACHHVRGPDRVGEAGVFRARKGQGSHTERSDPAQALHFRCIQQRWNDLRLGPFKDHKTVHGVTEDHPTLTTVPRSSVGCQFQWTDFSALAPLRDNAASMGLRLVAFGLAFNLLYGLSHATLGHALASRLGWAPGMTAALVAPCALLAIAARLHPGHRSALIAVAASSVAACAFLAG